MPGLIVIVRPATVVAALMAASVGLVTACAGTAHARQPPTAIGASASMAATHVPASPAATRVPAPWQAVGAHRLPGVYLGAMDGPWHGPKVRPRALLLGADWTFARLRWRDWTSRHANGRGYWISCQSANGPCHNFWARVRVWRVQEHHDARYFARMKVTGRHGQVIRLVMSIKRGYWVQRKRR